MAWLSGLNLIMSTIALAIGSLSAAYFAKVWFERNPIPRLREELNRVRQALSELHLQHEALERRARGDTPMPKPAIGELPPESIQVWLRPVGAQDAALAETRAGAPILLVANLKGGVAKTMLAANLGAYFSIRAKYPRTAHLANRRVLLVDLDYQGSLSDMILTGMNRGADSLGPHTRVETLFKAAISDEEACRHAVPPAANLPSLSLYPSQYAFDDFETFEQFRWLADTSGDDIRFRLLRRLGSPGFRDRFDMIILDTGPRLTMGSVAALAAATHVLVPTAPDRRSVEATERFLRQINELKKGGICPRIKVAGVVATLVGGTSGHRAVLADAQNLLQDKVDSAPELRSLIESQRVFFDAILPRSQPILGAAERGIPYLAASEIRAIMNGIGSEVEQRMQ